jgi:DNA adenine methylase
MTTPITYYGGKQKLTKKILSILPQHKLYAEPFIGGGAVFFSKEKSAVEVINDTNKELINFYKVVQEDFVSLEKHIRITLHSRDLHRKAKVIYGNPDMFDPIRRAWAVWVLANESFAAKLDGTFGYDISKNTTSKKINNKRNSFTEEYAIRLQEVQIECTDAIRIIRTRDTPTSLFYCDPPYYNSDMGHYDGYTIEDFERLLMVLSKIKGKFLLSSYPSPILESFVKKHAWNCEQLQMDVTVANKNKATKRKVKTEVLTSNFPFSLN